jgi:hypothetical protein
MWRHVLLLTCADVSEDPTVCTSRKHILHCVYCREHFTFPEKDLALNMKQRNVPVLILNTNALICLFSYKIDISTH